MKISRVRTDLILLVVLVFIGLYAWHLGASYGVDNAVYREGGSAVLHGRSLYDPLLTLPSWCPPLPFTYPPAAGVLFAPLALIPLQLGWTLMAAMSALALGMLPRTLQCGMIMVLLAVAAEPVWRSLSLGQVNIVLMGLILLDVLALRGSRYSGMLIGLTAAVKLTPLIFVLHLLLVGRRADAARAAGTFGAASLVGALVLPVDSLHYWTEGVLGGNNATANSWFGNQSINGLVQRLSGEADGAFTVVVVLSVLVLVLGGLAVRSLAKRDEPVAALLVTAFCGLLVSPISWTHHWVWVVPTFIFLGSRLRTVRQRVGLVLLASLFTGWVLRLVPNGGTAELHWTPLQVLLGNAYLWAVVPLLVMLVRVPAAVPAPEADADELSPAESARA